MSAFSDAAKAQIAGGGIERVYKIGAVPSGATYPYITLACSFDGAEAYTLDADHGLGVRRLTTQAQSKTLDGAEDLDDKARAVLLDKRIGAFGPGVMQVGGAVNRDPDDAGVITITSTYLFRSEE